MDTQEDRIDGRKRTDKASVGAKASEALPRRSSTRRKRQPAAVYNPGQIRLLEELVWEFACHRAIAQVPGGPELRILMASDISHLGAFIDFKMGDLVKKQKRLARIWGRTATVAV